MWKVPVLLFVLGSASLWIAAEGASTARPEDDIVTTDMEDGMEITGREDNIVTTGAIEKSYESTTLNSLVTTSTKIITDMHIEDHTTMEGTTQDQEGTQSTTPLNVATTHSHSTEKIDDDTEIIIEKDGMSTVTLIGIIVGVLLAIGFIGGIIFVVVKKMSGRYSP